MCVKVCAAHKRDYVVPFLVSTSVLVDHLEGILVLFLILHLLHIHCFGGPRVTKAALYTRIIVSKWSERADLVVCTGCFIPRCTYHNVLAYAETEFLSCNITLPPFFARMFCIRLVCESWLYEPLYLLLIITLQ